MRLPPEEAHDVTINMRDIEANGLTFRCQEAGPEGGEPIVLLHGFPETSHMWVELLPALAEAGYRCLAPDQRGYSPAARPDNVEAYLTDNLVADTAALAEAAGFREKYHLIGHDWGAGVGWRFVGTRPEKLASWTALSIPHPASYGRAFAEDPDQQEKSQYILFFQQPGAAEEMLLANDAAALKAVWDKSSPEEVEEYVRVLTAPGALTAALNWYRANFGGGALDPSANQFEVTVPTLTIWGNQDQAVGRATTLHHNDYIKGPNRWLELDAGHWLIQEKFETVRDEILAHLRAFPVR
jgi:pimeloyl-ACP methyl ester carboxylesterase